MLLHPGRGAVLFTLASHIRIRNLQPATAPFCFLFCFSTRQALHKDARRKAPSMTFTGVKGWKWGGRKQQQAGRGWMDVVCDATGRFPNVDPVALEGQPPVPWAGVRCAV